MKFKRPGPVADCSRSHRGYKMFRNSSLVPLRLRAQIAQYTIENCTYKIFGRIPPVSVEHCPDPEPARVRGQVKDFVQSHGAVTGPSCQKVSVQFSNH